MTTEALSKIIVQSLNSISLQSLKDANKKSMKDKMFAFLKLVTGDVIGSAESVLQGFSDYKEGEFFRKYICYLYELKVLHPVFRWQSLGQSKRCCVILRLYLLK